MTSEENRSMTDISDQLSKLIMSSALNTTALKILVSIVDNKKNIGLVHIKGATRQDIIEKSKISPSTVGRSLKTLIDNKLVEEGVKKSAIGERGYQKTYIVTEIGRILIGHVIDVKGRKKESGEIDNE